VVGSARRIQLKVNADATEATLDTDTGRPGVMPFILPGVHELSAMHDGLAAELKKFQSSLPAGVVNFDKAEVAMNSLRDIGTRLAEQFFGGPDQVDAASWFFRTAIPDWETNDGNDVSVTLEAPLGALFPLELLPLFDYATEWSVTDKASLVTAARRLVGFSSRVSRNIVRHPLPRRARSFRSGLEVRMLHDLSLEGAKLEAEDLNAMPLLNLDGPWPEKLARLDDAADFVAAGLSDVHVAGAESNRLPAQFIHFACHGNTSALQANDYAIRIQGTSGGARWVSLRDLGTRMTQRYALLTPEQKARPRPVVVMNACGSARLDPRTAASFPDLFLTHRHAGFIGAETDVPDALAANFSKSFYRTLSRGETIGHALHRARWTLLERWCNPLGILWTAYIDPDYRPLDPKAPGHWRI
jgi:hypothetical protein